MVTSGVSFASITNQGDSPITIRVSALTNENNPDFELTGLTSGVTYRYMLSPFNGNEIDFSDEVEVTLE